MSRNNVNVTKHHLYASAIIMGILSGGFVDYRASFIEDFRHENIDFSWENHWIPKNFTVKSRSSSSHLSYYIFFYPYESKDPGNERTGISSFRYGLKKK